MTTPPGGGGGGDSSGQQHKAFDCVPIQQWKDLPFQIESIETYGAPSPSLYPNTSPPQAACRLACRWCPRYLVQYCWSAGGACSSCQLCRNICRVRACLHAYSLHAWRAEDQRLEHVQTHTYLHTSLHSHTYPHIHAHTPPLSAEQTDRHRRCLALTIMSAVPSLSAALPHPTPSSAIASAGVLLSCLRCLAITAASPSPQASSC